MSVKKLSLEDIELIAHRLAKELTEGEEPIPAFVARSPNRLESCLEQPFMSVGGQDLYKGLFRKAALLFYLVIKNHPFANGNKRMAVTILITFLFINNYSLMISNEEMYSLACTVANSRPQDKDEVLESLRKVVYENKRRLKSS